MALRIVQVDDHDLPHAPRAGPRSKVARRSTFDRSEIVSITNLTEATFPVEIRAHRGVALVDFWAPWCGPCRRVGPIVDELASEFAGTVNVAKLDVDAHPAIAEQFNVRSIPTLLFFRDGRVVDSVVGVVPKRELVTRLQTLAA